MNKAQIETWALRVIDQVDRKQPNEDSRVELKGEWIPAKKAARRLAGQANAAFGEPILWLIGVDEEKGVIGAGQNELANWWPQISAEFDGVAPSLVSLNVPAKDKTVVALYFETDRSPFVIRNPAGGQVALEVPWREGNSTRTAGRSDLLKLLVPKQSLPDFEILHASMSARADTAGSLISWSMGMRIYVEPRTSERVVIPFHRCTLEMDLQAPIIKLQLRPPAIQPDKHSKLIEGTNTEIICNGPGMIDVSATGNSQILPDGLHVTQACLNRTAKLSLKLFPRKNGPGVSLDATVQPRLATDGCLIRWA